MFLQTSRNKHFFPGKSRRKPKLFQKQNLKHRNKDLMSCFPFAAAELPSEKWSQQVSEVITSRSAKSKKQDGQYAWKGRESSTFLSSEQNKDDPKNTHPHTWSHTIEVNGCCQMVPNGKQRKVHIVLNFKKSGQVAFFGF